MSGRSGTSTDRGKTGSERTRRPRPSSSFSPALRRPREGGSSIGFVPRIRRSPRPPGRPLAWIINTRTICAQSSFINTPLQRDDFGCGDSWNRFNGFRLNQQTVKTVLAFRWLSSTGLKPGVNETCVLRYRAEVFLTPVSGLSTSISH